jgi:hypothetical protein
VEPVHRRQRARLEEIANGLGEPAQPAPLVSLTDWDADAELKLTAAALYAVSDLSDGQLQDVARRMSDTERAEVIAALVGDRTNRRHKPGRAMERISYRFDILCDFGAFRDLQRHRLLTIEWQRLSTRLGHDRPPDVVEAGLGAEWDATMAQAGDLYERIRRQSGRMWPSTSSPSPSTSVS